jgi:hypothetical protein
MDSVFPRANATGKIVVVKRKKYLTVSRDKTGME